MEHETYELEKVRCGKPACKSCPHGPYWYAYRTTNKGKVVKRYIGKKLPPEIRQKILTSKHWRGRVMAIRRVEEED
jgi:hypothetical protein